MKAVFVLFLACAVSAQFSNFFRPAQHRFGGGQFRGPSVQSFPGNQLGGAAVDRSSGGSDYHFSWVHTGPQAKFVWGQAVGYCNRLGGGFRPISIDSPQENELVKSAIRNIEYIWTGGQRSGRGFAWSTGRPVGNLGWSHTGGFGRPQPDNREGNENCLAVLNNFYNDGITWHDVACHHQKPIICERSNF